MLNKRVENGIISPANKRILLAFSTPKTPQKAMLELCLKKIGFNDYIKAGLLKCLNPEESRARFYVLADKARKLLSQPPCDVSLHKDWNCIGWVMSGPKMKLAVLRCVDERKLYSEEIRIRASQFNCHLSRTSVKDILKGLVEKHLVDTEIMERVRFYWITPHGQKIKDELAVIAPLSPST
jgi:DNA-binding MarR family transcriptional regulator